MALNLVDYSDSDSQSDNECNPPKRVCTLSLSPAARSALGPHPVTDLPPLPSRFHDLYVAAPRLATRDDPSLHGGRQRAVPHELGNWPTFVFLEWHLNAAEFNGKRKARHHTKDEGFVKAQFKLISSLVSDLGAEQPLHVSLSRPNNLKTEERARFVDLLEERIHKARLKPFDIFFKGFEWVSNSDGTRWFFVMTAKSEENELSTLLRLTNSSFAMYRQPALYSEHKGDNGFHVTLGWSLEAPEKELMRQLETDTGNEFKTQLSQLTMKVEEVKIKIGNIIKLLPLGA
ncbi:U6 snRNA phosphodiesterase Usb1 [Tirmania nivea]|nr:U6 snRNA phosphodiesterase Usb1 [Tirmania nivea]